MAQQLTRITIPDDVGFSDLRLARDSDGMVSFDWTPIERICAASGVEVALLRDGPEANVAGLVVRWYEAHLDAGGEIDPIAEDLLAEVRAEDTSGQHVSHAPGRA